MPKLIRLYIVNVSIGFVAAAVFVGMLLWFNVANLWHLVTHSDKGWLAVLILWLANGIVFAGVQFAIAVMAMKDDDDDDDDQGGHGSPVMQHDHVAIPVRADGDRRA
ncbi:hypothetical protein [Roseovarius sp. E0-M6]|uniref:hypothetical protein n=1 Tax=Roseovarius sp. E0-M6 TaxID=3127118 RepID=UPI00300FACC6